MREIIYKAIVCLFLFPLQLLTQEFIDFSHIVHDVSEIEYFDKKDSIHYGILDHNQSLKAIEELVSNNIKNDSLSKRILKWQDYIKLDSLRDQVLNFMDKDFLETNSTCWEHSIYYEIEKIYSTLSIHEIYEYEYYTHLKSQKLLNNLKISQTRTKLLSIILLLLSSATFIYLLFYTEKKYRQKSVNKIIAAKEINKTEIEIKNKISEQLHDNIGGSLAALKMRLSQLNDPNYYQALKLEINNLELIYHQVRDLSHDLSSNPKFTSSFYEKLNISIENMTGGFTSKSINVFPIERVNSISDENLQLSILSTCKELITNVIKHAKAEMINIDIAAHEDELTIIVLDNGIGFDPLKVSGSLGFSQIKSRTLLYDGVFEIDSNKNNGTTITASFKLKN